MKKLLTLSLSAMLFASTCISAQASYFIIESHDNTPTMRIEYERTPSVEVTIPAYTPAPESTPKPTDTPKPETTPSPKPSEVTGDYERGTVYGPNLSTKELKQLREKVGEIVAVHIEEGMTEEEKVIVLVNYVYDHCSYAPDWSKNRANTAWGALVYGEAQCSGYARAMVALFDAVGIESRYVHAAKDDPVNPSHQWNLLKLGDVWYHMDVQMVDSSNFTETKPIFLMGSHLKYDESTFPDVLGQDLRLQ